MRKVISLSHTLRPGIPCWPGDPVFSTTPIADVATVGWSLRKLELGEHTGTHVNTSATFFPHGFAPDRFPPDYWIRNGICIDLPGEDPNRRLQVADIFAWEERHGLITSDSLILLNTGWERYWSDPVKFFGHDAAGIPHFPGFSPHAAAFLMEHRHAAGLGIDTHGLDGGNDTEFSVNRAVLETNRIAVECLANLDLLPPRGFTLTIGALPIEHGTGSPAMVFALLNSQAEAVVYAEK